MANNISIAIIGLSLSTTNHIKKLLKHAINDQYHLNWSNIADKSLNLLIINESFIDSPAIRNINIQNLKTLVVQHNEIKANTIFENQLFMPFNDEKLLNTWLIQNIFSHRLSKEPSVTKHTSTEQNTLTLDHLTRCLTQKNEQFFQCIINHTQCFLIDLKLQEIRVSSDFKINTIDNFQLKTLTFNEVVNLRNQKEKYDLSYWLWNFLWNHLDNIPTASDQYYQLSKWPQPIQQDAKECLKIAAYFQHGAHRKYVLERANCDSKLLDKFIYVSTLANMLNDTHEEKAKFKLQHSYQPQSQIKSFFSKIRKKLGI